MYLQHKQAVTIGADGTWRR